MASAIAARLSERLPASAPAINERLRLLQQRIDSVSTQIKKPFSALQSCLWRCPRRLCPLGRLFRPQPGGGALGTAGATFGR